MARFYQGVKLIDSESGDEDPIGTSANPLPAAMYLFDALLLDWVPATGGDGVGAEVVVTNSIAVGSSVLPTGASTETTLALIKAKTDNIDVLLSTRTKPADTQKVDGSAVIQPISAAALPLPAGAAAESGNLATLTAKDFATQTTLAAVLAKIIAAPATEAKQDTLNAKDFATQATLAAVLAKIIASPATEAKQDTLIAKDFATQTTLAAVLAKIIAAPATEATLAAILAKIIAAPATEATLALIKAKTDNLDVLLSTRTKPADTQPVSGTFWQATQPVSGSVSVTPADLAPSAPAAASVGVASAQVVAANANRRGLVLVNLSNERISLGFGSPAVLDSGVTLYGPGGVFEMTPQEFDVGAVNAIASAAASALAIQEWAA